MLVKGIIFHYSVSKPICRTCIRPIVLRDVAVVGLELCRKVYWSYGVFNGGVSTDCQERHSLISF